MGEASTEKKSVLLTMRMGNNHITKKGGIGPLVSEECSLTLSCNNLQVLFVWTKKENKKKKTKKGNEKK